MDAPFNRFRTRSWQLTAAALGCLAGEGLAGADSISPPLESRQALLVVAPEWKSSSATLQRFARVSAGGRWDAAGQPMPVLVGERGLGWGLGLHRIPDDGGPRKVEGDRRAPAGIFRLTGAFGRAAKPQGSLPWQAITPTLEAIDDPASRFYNRVVDRARVAQPDWRSSERMATIPDYALGVVVAHNPQNVRGAGSCIFLHLWLGERRGTAGCTVLRERDLLTLVRWLDPAQRPVLIQLPRDVARRELDGF